MIILDYKFDTDKIAMSDYRREIPGYCPFPHTENESHHYSTV